MAQANILTRSKKSKAAELYKANCLEEADALYSGVCQADGTDVDAWVMRGIINRKLGRFIEAEACCRRALMLAPRLAAAHHALGSAVLSQGRIEEAMAGFRRAIQLQPDFAESHYLLANALKESGELNEAAACYRRAIAIQPDFVEALGNLGTLLTIMGDVQQAAEFLNRAERLRPNVHQIQSALGRVLFLEGQVEQAIIRFQQALRLNPDPPDTASELANLLEKSSRLDEAQALIDMYLPQSPDNPALLLVAAKLARRAGRLQETVDCLERAAQQKQSPQSLGEVRVFLGQMYDRLGDSERAYGQLAEGNLLLSTTIGSGFGRGDYLERVDRVARYLTPQLAQTARVEMNNEEAPSPVFLFGFARSGTTLLEQILDSHPAIQAMEEKGAVDTMFAAFEKLTEGREDALASLTPQEIGQLRKAYFDEVERHIKLKPGSVLVDKMPLNTIFAHLIWRVFPHSKLVLAIRHPCDVCLSCFMQNFVANEAMVNFYSLDNTVKVYARVMELWQEAVRLLSLDYHRVRYEDLVVNFEVETLALLDYIGVGWNENVRSHTAHAIKRGTIKTASYHQVTQPIYQHAKYRWERYSKHFEPFMATLQPFVEYFDYFEQTEIN